MILQNRLKVFRAILNVNQQEMGRLCGVSRQTISLIERGDYSPSVTLALTIAHTTAKSKNLGRAFRFASLISSFFIFRFLL